MHEWILWVLLFASAFHVVEEHALGWQGWAARAFGTRLGVRPTWADFWATNAALVVFGLAAAEVGWRAPAFALAFPALCLINAVVFHLLPSLAARRPNPGVFTATALYVPLSVWAYLAAADDGVLSAPVALGSVLVGALAMGSAIGVLVLHKRLAYPDVPTEAPESQSSSSSRGTIRKIATSSPERVSG